MSAKYYPTIGIECHVQLATKTKLFSEVDNDARGKEPNSCVSPVDYALPGMLPRLNHAAVLMAVRAGHAMNCEINAYSRFDRKHYFYPDSPKGYQITQLYNPIIGAGKLVLSDGSEVRIEHAHLEGDAGKLTHYSNYSLVDLNRVDTPLIEIVSMPDMHSAHQAQEYCKELWRTMLFAGVTLGDLYNGNMRFDVNISLAPEGSDQLGTRAEIKNLNSFRSVERAVNYEIKRQSKILDSGEKVVQETRGWNDSTGETSPQRSKEAAQDYRYMPEPDLPPLRLSTEVIEAEKDNLPLLPNDYRQIFAKIIPADILEILLDYPQLSEKLYSVCFRNAPRARLHGARRSVLAAAADAPEASPSKASLDAAKLISNLFASVLLAEEKSVEMLDNLPSVEQLTTLAEMNGKQELSSTATKTVFLKFFDPDMRAKDTHTIAKELNLIQQNDAGALEEIVKAVLAKPETQQAQADFKAGQEKVIGFLVGQVMKESKGKANPAMAQQILRQLLTKSA